MDLSSHIVLPESYFLGADVFYDFVSLNDLHHLVDQKYKSREEIEAEYPHVREAYMAGAFPTRSSRACGVYWKAWATARLLCALRACWRTILAPPLPANTIASFAPTRAHPEENLEHLLKAISMVYASVFSPDALFYRQQMGLQDYDERMAMLLQEVQGERHGDFFFPTLAGVAFSHNPFRWTSKIRREDGFVRLVMGMGTRAVDRVSSDYPRMVALSHPDLRPEVGAIQIKRYSQHNADVISLTENEFQTRPVRDLLSMDFPSARLLASVDRGDYLQPPPAYDPNISSNDLVLTFDGLLTRTQFVPLMKEILETLANRFGRHVDVEFTADIVPGFPEPEFRFHLLQCRPQASLKAGEVGPGTNNRL